MPYKMKKCNLKQVRKDAEKMLSGLSARDLKHAHRRAFSEVLYAEKNDNGYSDCTKKQADYDSVKNAARACKEIKASYMRQIEFALDLIRFRYGNERIKHHYEVESLRADIDRLKKDNDRMWNNWRCHIEHPSPQSAFPLTVQSL